MRIAWTTATDAPASPSDYVGGGLACPRGQEERRGVESRGGRVRAAVGDRISIPGRHVGDLRREGEVVELRGTQEAPLYVVRWDDGHEGVCSPGAETQVIHRTST